MMTPAEFKQAMLQIAASDDPEDAHRQADELMLRVLREHGYDDGADVFVSMERWYA